MHFCRHGRKHVQCFKKTGLKLYEKCNHKQSQGTHCLYSWGQKITKFKKYKKVTKIWQGLYEKHMHIFRLWRKHVQSCKRISIKLCEELCSRGIPTVIMRVNRYKTVRGVALTSGTNCLYIKGEKWLSSNVEKVTKNNLTITFKPHTHPHTMKTYAKFQNDWYRTVRRVALTRDTHCLYTEGEKWLSSQCKKKWQKCSNNYTQTTCTFPYHEENICKVLKRSVQNCKRRCAHKRYPLSIYWGWKWLSSQCGKSDKNVLTIIPKPHAHPHTMKKTHAKFLNNQYKTVRGIALKRGTNCLYI